MRERSKDAYFIEAPVLERTGRPRQAFLPTIYRRPAVRDPLGERQVRLDPLQVGFVHEPRFCQLPLALGVLGRHEMASRSVGTQHFSGPGNLEPLGDGFSRLAARDGLGHKARKIRTPPRTDNRFSVYRPANTAII